MTTSDGRNRWLVQTHTVRCDRAPAALMRQSTRAVESRFERAANHEAGGVYLFDDEASLQAYLNGPIVASIGSNPALSDVSVKVFDPITSLMHITRGPIREGTRA